MSVRKQSPSRSLDRAVRRCVDVVEGVAFWTSVALPLAYPPLLAATALSDVGPAVVAAVVVANAVALVVGHDYRPENEDGSAGEGDELSTPNGEGSG